MTSPYGDTPLGLAAQILNLAAILTRRAALKVPRYQRPYTWTEKEVRRLIQDLWRAFDRGATFYFIGQIVLVKNEHGELEISDGQQRLATLTMILAYVRDRLPHRAEHYQNLIMPKEKEHERPRVILRDEDASFFRGHVQAPNQMQALAEHPEIGSDSKEQMRQAAGTIAAELGRTDDDKLDAFMAYVCRCATFNVVDADERGCAATVYNTINDTGLDLSGADNIKCDLLENSGLSNGEADAAARQWEYLEDQLGRRDFAVLLNMMPFLLTGADLISPGDLATFRAQIERAGGVPSFLSEKLPRYCNALIEINNGAVDVGPASEDVNRRLKLMKQLDDWKWAPAALAFLAEHRGDPGRAHRFFQALDRLAFACDMSIVPAAVQAQRFAEAARFAGDDERLYNAKGADGMALSRKRGVLELTEGEKNTFYQRLGHFSKKQRSPRLLVMRFESALEGGDALSLTDDVTVEHILPRKSAPWWTERFPDPVLREEAANAIGNMVLVTHRQNQLADNKPFPEKMRIYFHTKGAPIRALTRDIEGYTEWTLDAIGKRQERLVATLCEDWGLTPASTEERGALTRR